MFTKKNLIQLLFIFISILVLSTKVYAREYIKTMGWTTYNISGNQSQHYVNGRYYIDADTTSADYMAVIESTNNLPGPIFRTHCYLEINGNNYELPVKKAEFVRSGLETKRISVECDKGSIGNIIEGKNTFNFKIDVLLGNPPRAHISVNKTINVYKDTLAPNIATSITASQSCNLSNINDCKIKININAEDKNDGRINKLVVKYHKSSDDFRTKDLTTKLNLPNGKVDTNVEISYADLGITAIGSYQAEIIVQATDEIGNKKESKANLEITVTENKQPTTTTPTQPTATIEITPTPTHPQTPAKNNLALYGGIAAILTGLAGATYTGIKLLKQKATTSASQTSSTNTPATAPEKQKQ